MHASKLTSAGLAALFLALAACDTTIIERPSHGDGSWNVDAGEGEGGAGGWADEAPEGDDGTNEGGAGGADDPFDDGVAQATGVCIFDDGDTDPAACCEGLEWDDGSCLDFSWASCVDGEWVCDDDTPLVLSYDRSAPRMMRDLVASFDLSGSGICMASDWPAAATPWLVLDRDGDGAIGDGGELFGSATVLRDGRRARHGFEALAELDDDGNGVVDGADPSFARLAVWTDRDQDRETDAGELAPAAGGDRRLVAIDLAFRIDRRCDERGNCGIERAAFRWADAAGEHVGEIVDVHLPRR